MIRKRCVQLAAVVCTAALVLAACGDSTADTSAGSSGPTGDPVPGGTATVLQMSDPRTLDPALLGNSYAINAPLGNALYGTLMIDDPETTEVEFKMADDFSTSDSGATFELKLRDALKFSDGSPLNAEAVKFNWDRMRDRKVGSQYLAEASMIASTKVVDDTTLKVTMVAPVPNFAQSVLTTSMNWIASPKALKAGQQAFDANPVGAGPYTLKEWTRQGSIELVKNPDYWDAPRPYLDAITMRAATDANQRANTVISGGADLAVDGNWDNLARMKKEGQQSDVLRLSGGLYFGLNTQRAPFDDVRARRAFASAIDLGAINTVVYNGAGQSAQTLFSDASPFHSDRKLVKQDTKIAKRLFDELAAAGKPVSFTFKTFPTSEGKAMAESVQAQLSRFDNVSVKIETVDFAEAASLRQSRDYDVLVSSAFFTDPEPRLWMVFHGDSPTNISGIDDPELNEALTAGRTAIGLEERKGAYEVVEERLAELVPVLFLTRAAPGVLAGKHVGGIRQYGSGSLLPEELWIEK